MKNFIKVFICLIFFSWHLAGAETLTKFDTKNHPKSNGLWLTVKYPSDWRAAEGERPHIVQKFDKFDKVDKVVYESLLLQINPLPVGAMEEVNSFSVNDMKEVYEGFMPGAHASGVKKFIHEGQPAFIGNIDYSMDRVNQTFTFSQRLMVVFYKSNMILLYCGAGSAPSFKAQMLKRQQSLSDTVCRQYFNSLVLMDRY